MKPRTLRIPAVLGFSVLALGSAGCQQYAPPADSGADSTPAATCSEACTQIHSGVDTTCMASTASDGAVACVPVADTGYDNCGFEMIAYAGTTPCCCYPLV